MEPHYALDTHLDQEWREAQLLDRAEKAEEEASHLRDQLETQATDLLVARLWVRELSLWLDEIHDRAESGAPAEIPPLAPATEEALKAALARPINWRTPLTIAGMAAAAWGLFAALGYLIYLLVA